MVFWRVKSLQVMIGIFCVLLLSAPAFAAEYVIGANDVISITVLGEKELDTIAVVTPDGKIFIPLVGDVQAAGLTAEELSERLVRTLRNKIQSPEVSVSLREINSYRVYTLGSVARPGVVASKSVINLLQSLALAGGVTPGADLKLAYVARGNEKLDVDFRKLLIEGDLSQNIELKPEDVVMLPANPRNTIFIMGEVQNPGTFPLDLESQITILKALAGAGGFSKFAKPSKTVILREHGTTKRIIPVKINKILDNIKEDILLHPGDVIFVPK